MKWLLSLSLLLPVAAGAQIYRCAGGVFTNNTAEAIRHNCVPLEQRRKLSAEELRQFDACRMEAAKAPTELGVRTAMSVCREKFSQ